MGMVIFHTKIFKYLLVPKCFLQKDYILDKTSHSNQKYNVANMRLAFSRQNLIKIIVFCIKKCMQIQQ
jgi:hypothetical protein